MTIQNEPITEEIISDHRYDQLIEDFEFMLSSGESAERACDRLGIAQVRIEKEIWRRKKRASSSSTTTTTHQEKQ
jgi:hypothetical protein